MDFCKKFGISDSLQIFCILLLRDSGSAGPIRATFRQTLNLTTMKNLILTAVLLCTSLFSAFADKNNDRPITFAELPQAAQIFLNTHFSDLTVAFVVEETKFLGKEYEVVYTDRTEVDFNGSGEWENVERKYSAVPDAIVPQAILDFVAASQFSNMYIRAIERNAYTWEIELANGLEIKFDKNFKVIGYDD